MFRIGLVSAAMAATLFSTSVEAARCPPGQIYRVSKKFCQDKATAIKQGVFKPRKSHKGPLRLTPKARTKTKAVRRNKARRLKKQRLSVPRPPARTTPVNNAAVKRPAPAPNIAARPIGSEKPAAPKKVQSKKVTPKQDVPATRAPAPNAAVPGSPPQKLSPSPAPQNASPVKKAKPRKLSRENQPKAIAPATSQNAVPVKKPAANPPLSPLRFARPQNPATKLKKGPPRSSGAGLKSPQKPSRIGAPRPRLANPAAGKPAAGKPREPALKLKLRRHVEKNRAKYTNRVRPQ